MTNELLAITRKIDLALTYYLKNHEKLQSASVVLDMAPENYIDKDQNTYTIIVIGENLKIQDILELDDFLTKLLPQMESNEIKITLSPFPTNIKDKKELFINLKMYTKEQFEKALTATLKHQLALTARHLYGEKYLQTYKNVKLSRDDIINDLRIYLESLGQAQLQSIKQLPNILSLVNMLFQEIYNYANDKYMIPPDKIGFFIRLLGQNNCQTGTLFLLHSIFLKTDDILKKMYSNPIQELYRLVILLEKQFMNIDQIYELKGTKKLTKRLFHEQS